MPTTVNGVGTHYYGKRDIASRVGTCQYCGTQGKLDTYTTRLWFVIVFIPIIPLKRVRLLDYCPRCSRHWVADPEQYEMSRQLAVSGAMEKYRDAPSVDAALAVHAQLLSFHMHPEADRFREATLEQYADSAELRATFGAHLDQMGRWTEATPLYEQAFLLKPDLPEVRNSLAWRRVNESKFDEAFKLLDFLRQPGAGLTFNLAPLEGLAASYQKFGNHERVIEICEHLLREIPEAGEKHQFRKLVSKSERVLVLDRHSEVHRPLLLMGSGLRFVERDDGGRRGIHLRLAQQFLHGVSNQNHTEAGVVVTARWKVVGATRRTGETWGDHPTAATDHPR